MKLALPCAKKGCMGRHKSYNRDDVLEKAMTLFWAKGFEGAHLSELVEVTGIKRFSLYAEFGGKDGLFQEALELYLQRALAVYDATLKMEPYGLDNLRNYFKEMSYGDDYHGCFLINTLTEQNIVTSTAFDAARQVTQRARELFFMNVQAAQGNGEIGPDKNIEALANLLSTLDSGLSIYGIVSPSDEEKDAIVAQALYLLS